VRSLRVQLDRSDEQRWQLQYRLEADLQGLCIPDPKPTQRADELWRHTCFELFVGEPGSGAYAEYNFSPSLSWAAYQFDGYRTGMRRSFLPTAPRLRAMQSERLFELDVTLTMPTALSQPCVAFCAVLEDRLGALTYWAIRHPGSVPDFHHAAGFLVLKS
jgi:hypothetical protein